MAARCVRPLHAAIRGVWGSSQVRLRDGVLSEALMAFSASPAPLEPPGDTFQHSKAFRTTTCGGGIEELESLQVVEW